MRLKKKTRSESTNLLYGFHTVSAAWLNPRRECTRLRLTRSACESLQSTFEQARVQRLHRPTPIVTSDATLDTLVPRAVHQGVVLETRPLPEPDWREFLNRPLRGDVVILDQVTDPHNIGAILRSALAFDCRAVVVLRRHMPAITGTLAKSACGALEFLEVFRVANVSCSLDQLRTAGYTCVGLDQRAQQTLHNLTCPTPIAFVFGAEGKGLRRLTVEHCDVLTKIPTTDPMKTLNVSNTVAITLYERTRQVLVL